jgi:hypothetical protein
MMKTLSKAAAVVLLAVPAMAMAQSAPDQACYGLRYSLDFLNVYPHAPAMCQAVKAHDGINYARLDAVVRKKQGNFVTVGFKDVFGNKLDDLEIKAVAGSKVTVNGKHVSWSDVSVGDKLTFWLPERALHVVPEPGDGYSAPIVIRTK